MKIFNLVIDKMFPLVSIVKDKNPYKFRSLNNIKTTEYAYEQNIKENYRLTILYLLLIIVALFMDAFYVFDLIIVIKILFTYLGINNGLMFIAYKKYEKQRIEDGKVEYLKRKMKGEL